MFISFRGAIGCGKTTAAHHLVKEYDFYRVSFADPLKCEVFDFLWSRPEHSFKVVDNEDDRIWSRYRAESGDREMYPRPDWDFRGADLYCIGDDDKIRWVNYRKAKLRPLLQWWGTEYRRAENEDYWVDKAETYMRELLTAGRSIVMDDCRFDNEMELVAALGGKQVFIVCPKAEQLALERSGGGAVGIKGHASEGLLDPKDERNDVVIINDGSLDSFLAKVNGIVMLVRHDNLGALLHQPL